ncbi:MAG: hypothetical protein ISR85_04610 [Kiritimatiellales bacterium]|nr:hypothetical protein [Kiritimatiellota bacterium]MBL7012192.1 hypothetical protein [Kiritimatiellales bacterium]
MDRFRKHSMFTGMPKGRVIGFLALMGFVLFIAFRILTPPTEVVQRISAPDGSREARLQHVFYYSDPGYKISTRTRRFWHTQLYLPEYKGDSAEQRKAAIRWSADSKELFFEINGTPVWSESF